MRGLDQFQLGDPPAPTPAGLLETHVQTQQKLEVMLRYWEVWCTIIAQARGFPILRTLHVAESMGLRNTTADVYAHLTPAMLERSANRMDAILKRRAANR
ncbi:MAG TPA: hypothetical protein VIK11_07465 [Tepidiformaceae bacterium]|jgi:hypothetical protein